jgi:hypothetical protein
MSGMSRRDLLRASAGAAAIAVPMSVLSQGRASAAAGDPDVAAAATGAAVHPEGDVAGLHGEALAGPVMFSILDARSGDVSILHGTSEVIVRDRQLVDRILRAARRVA